jgi:hypothetical protein
MKEYSYVRIPLLPLWAVLPVQSLSACTRVTFTFFYVKCNPDFTVTRSEKKGRRKEGRKERKRVGERRRTRESLDVPQKQV